MQTKHTRAPQPPRQMPPWLIILIDCVLIGVSLLVFALFDHVIPEVEQSVPIVSTTPEPVVTVEPASDDTQPEADAQPEIDSQPEADVPAEPTPVPTVEEGDFSLKFADKFTDGAVIQTDTTYQSPNLNITLNTYKFNVGSYEQVAYVEDIYVRKIECFRSCLAKDKYGKAITEEVLDMAKRCDAVCAINGDYYGHNKSGIVIRDGVLYRGTFGADMETLVLFRDGTMKGYRRMSEFDADEVMAQGAWQGWCFGPLLLDGQGNLFERGYKSVNHDPRTIVGMIEPGHYVFIVVDGRQNGYSEGLTYKESAELCQKLGCVIAFNLDGGKTSQMTFNGETANHPYHGGREISDILYIAEP